MQESFVENSGDEFLKVGSILDWHNRSAEIASINEQGKEYGRRAMLQYALKTFATVPFIYVALHSWAEGALMIKAMSIAGVVGVLIAMLGVWLLKPFLVDSPAKSMWELRRGYLRKRVSVLGKVGTVLGVFYDLSELREDRRRENYANKVRVYFDDGKELIFSASEVTVLKTDILTPVARLNLAYFCLLLLLIGGLAFAKIL